MWDASSAFRACVPALAAAVALTASVVAWTTADAARSEGAEVVKSVVTNPASILPRPAADAEPTRPWGRLVEVPAERMPPEGALIPVE